jgi:hypothetical protein
LFWRQLAGLAERPVPRIGRSRQLGRKLGFLLGRAIGQRFAERRSRAGRVFDLGRVHRERGGVHRIRKHATVPIDDVAPLRGRLDFSKLLFLREL